MCQKATKDEEFNDVTNGIPDEIANFSRNGKQNEIRFSVRVGFSSAGEMYVKYVL